MHGDGDGDTNRHRDDRGADDGDGDGRASIGSRLALGIERLRHRQHEAGRSRGGEVVPKSHGELTSPHRLHGRELAAAQLGHGEPGTRHRGDALGRAVGDLHAIAEKGDRDLEVVIGGAQHDGTPGSGRDTRPPREVADVVGEEVGQHRGQAGGVVASGQDYRGHPMRWHAQILRHQGSMPKSSAMICRAL